MSQDFEIHNTYTLGSRYCNTNSFYTFICLLYPFEIKLQSFRLESWTICLQSQTLFSVFLLLSAFLLMKQLHQFLEVVSEVVMEAPLGLPLSQLSSQQQLSLPPRRKGISSVPKLGSTACKRSYLEGMAVFSNLFAPSGCFLCVFFCSRPKLFHIKIVSNSLLP